jgi:16S rRNA (cytosine1402-N4)-methyltransferase
MKHVPVLLEDVLEQVKAIAVHDGFFMDGTFGRGGHTRAILEARPDFKVIGLDCDEEAIAYGFKEMESLVASGRLTLLRGNFSDFDKVLSASPHQTVQLAGILLDLGVSSPQLDEGRRGFSFYHDGPLDMRMDQSQEFTAADIVNGWDEKGLNDLFHNLGEVRSPFRVTKKILDMRKERAFSTTGELAHLIEKSEGWHKKGQHPATQYFLALRLEVNQELARLEKILAKMVDALLPQGRLLVITFHSLEDRIVKVAFKALDESGVGKMVNKKVIQAEWDEKKKNPRARSAKLRVFEKL